MKKIGLLCLALVLALGAMGGAIAYFSDTATETKTFSAGTIDLQIATATHTSPITCSGGWHDNMTWSIGPDWAPGDEVQECECMRNMGTTGGKVLRVNGVVVSDPNNLATKIIINKVCFSENNEDYPGLYGNLVGYYEGIFGDCVAPLYLSEFIGTGYGWPEYSIVLWGPWNIGPTMGDYISPSGGDIEWLCLGFEFESSAGNEYQGKVLTFDLEKTLTDDYSILGKGALCYGYGE